VDFVALVPMPDPEFSFVGFVKVAPTHLLAKIYELLFSVGLRLRVVL
jgi:hypothetical protein